MPTSTPNASPYAKPPKLEMISRSSWTSWSSLKAQLARLPTRRDQAFTPLRIMMGSALLSAALVILWFETFWRHCLEGDREPSAMYGPELRTCGLGAVVAVLVGAGILEPRPRLTYSADKP